MNPGPSKAIHRVAIVGTGVIGASWAALFLAKGLQVVATDIAPNAETALRKFVKTAWPALERLGLSPGASQSTAPEVPAYPIAYDAGKALNAAAKSAGEAGFGAQWAGQGAPLARALPAADLVATLAGETKVF